MFDIRLFIASLHFIHGNDLFNQDVEAAAKRGGIVHKQYFLQNGSYVKSNEQYVTLIYNLYTEEPLRRILQSFHLFCVYMHVIQTLPL